MTDEDYTIVYETDRASTRKHPHDIHFDIDGVVTCLWYKEEGGVKEAIHIPYQRVYHVRSE